MEIKRVLKNSLQVSSKMANLVAFGEGLTQNQLKDLKTDIVLDNKVDGVFGINSPGEYETKEIWAMGFTSDPKKDIPDVYVLSVDEIKLAILKDSIKSLTKKNIEKIGLIDVLIIDISSEIDSKVDLVGEIDPRIVIPINYTEESFTKFSKELGVNQINEDKKFKAKLDDFALEDYQLQIFKLL